VLKTGLATVLPQLTLLEERADNLVAIDLYDPTPVRRVALLHNRAHYVCAASRAFMDIAREGAGDLVGVSAPP
jgi:DNA-binding transcriptional LysR family regulator